jgi:hypothetical protein
VGFGVVHVHFQFQVSGFEQVGGRRNYSLGSVVAWWACGSGLAYFWRWG